MMHWPWRNPGPHPGMAEARESLLRSEENLALSEHLQSAAEGQAQRLDGVRRRNGLVEAVKAEWRRDV